MFEDDIVLIGVINRSKDLELAKMQQWYRIPLQQFPDGIHAQYLGFFLSRSFGEQNGAIHYYAEICGTELVYRRWLLPDESNHPRADEMYLKLSIGNLIRKNPPVINHNKRTVSFLQSSWANFITARTLNDLKID